MTLRLTEIATPALTQRQIRLGMDIVSALVVASVGVALAGLTWRVVQRDDAEPSMVAAVAPAVAPATGVDVAPILALAPFGVNPVSASAGSATAVASGLQLRGTVLAYGRRPSQALIAAGDAPAESYGVGQAVPGGAVLAGIASDHVVLQVGSGRETLRFPDGPGASAPATATAAAASTAPTGVVSANTPVVTSTAPAAAAPTAPAQSGAAAIRALIPPSVSGVAPQAAPPRPSSNAAPGPSAAASPQAMLNNLGAAATSGGYRVGQSASPDLLRAGLRPGDVVERVNGVAVGNVQSDRRLFEQAAASGTARVEVIRNGRRITLSVPLR